MSFPITAYVIPEISNYFPPLDLEEIKEKFPYQKDVDVTLNSESVDLLVGQDYHVFLRQLETRYGKLDEPYTLCEPYYVGAFVALLKKQTIEIYQRIYYLIHISIGGSDRQFQF